MAISRLKTNARTYQLVPYQLRRIPYYYNPRPAEAYYQEIRKQRQLQKISVEPLIASRMLYVPWREGIPETQLLDTSDLPLRDLQELNLTDFF